MKYVLFVCNHNAGRSQMAQAFFDTLAPPDIRAQSAGTEPATQIWPAVVEVMNEVGLDISDRRPKKLTREMQLHADLAVTMGCGDACPYVPAAVVDWDIPDPAGEPLDRVREVRDMVREHVRTLVAERLDQIRSDPSPHQQRLDQMMPALAKEFEGRHSLSEIRVCADAVLSRFDDARVRAHVVVVSLRQTRDCLRQEQRDALALKT